VLVGGGHAHLAVLSALATQCPDGLEVVLITSSSYHNYRSMLPGWVAGQYPLSTCRVNLELLAQAAGVRLLLDQVVGMDAARRCVALKAGKSMDYDLLSLDVGSETDTSWLEVLGTKLLSNKPVDNFVAQWPHLLAQAKATPGYQLVVVGGGVAGVEMALAAKHAFSLAGVQGSVDLVASESGLLPGHAPGVQVRVTRLTKQAGIGLHFLRGVGVEEGVLLSDGRLLPADRVIAATGARAPIWLGWSKLGLDAHGYLLVDKHQRSVSHPNVFAAGDVCARADAIMSNPDKDAFHVGSVLAHNLVVMLNGGVFQAHVPKRRKLYLLWCGSRYAVVSWGRWSAGGQWVWHLKDWINRRFIGRFTNSGSIPTSQILEHTP